MDASTTMTMTIKGELTRVRVIVSGAGLSWSFTKHGLFHHSEVSSTQLLQPIMESSKDEDACKLITQYVRITTPDRDTKRILARRNEVIFNASYHVCHSIKSQIEDLLHSKDPPRPKRVLLFINPMSGYQRAVSEYQTIVAPLMERCGVSVHVIVTKSKTHAAEVLQDYDLASIDAVLSMGGDGALNQVTTGLIQRTMREANRDINDHTVALLKPTLSVASLPSGSGCGVALYTCGTTSDLETATLSIILGQTKPYDVLELRNRGVFLNCANLISGLGIFTNAFLWLEKLHWMGRLRYWLVVPKSLRHWFRFQLEIDYLPVPEKECEFRLDVECQTPLPNHVQIRDGPRPGWKTLNCLSSEVWFTPYYQFDCLRHCELEEYHRPNFTSGKALLSVFLADSFWKSKIAYANLFKGGKTKLPRHNAIQIEVFEFHIRGIDEWRDPSIGLAIHGDGDIVQLPNGPTFEVKIARGLLSFFCLNPDLVDHAKNETTNKDLNA